MSTTVDKNSSTILSKTRLTSNSFKRPRISFESSVLLYKNSKLTLFMPVIIYQPYFFVDELLSAMIKNIFRRIIINHTHSLV